MTMQKNVNHRTEDEKTTDMNTWTAKEHGRVYRSVQEAKGRFYVEMVSLFAVMGAKAVRPFVEKQLQIFEEVHRSVQHIQDREQQRDALRALAFSDESPSTAENPDVDRSTVRRLETWIGTDRWKEKHVNWMLHIAIGLAYQAIGDASDLNQALHSYRQASEQFPDRYQPNILLARVLRMQGQYDESKEAFRKAADLLGPGVAQGVAEFIRRILGKIVTPKTEKRSKKNEAADNNYGTPLPSPTSAETTQQASSISLAGIELQVDTSPRIERPSPTSKQRTFTLSLHTLEEDLSVYRNSHICVLLEDERERFELGRVVPEINDRRRSITIKLDLGQMAVEPGTIPPEFVGLRIEEADDETQSNG